MLQQSVYVTIGDGNCARPRVLEQHDKTDRMKVQDDR